MIKIGSYVIIQKLGGDHLRLTHVTKPENILIEKLKFNINDAIGKTYGLYEANAGRLTLVKQNSDLLKDENCLLSNKSEFLLNNIDENTNFELPLKRQKLTHSDIDALKDAGVSTFKLISKLVDGNTSFNTRSEFSRQKYVEKKTKKHSSRVLLLKPNIRLLAECYYKRSAERIAHLRIDLLGYILQVSAIHVGCRVFVFEQALGLLGAAVIDRLAGEGVCIYLHCYDVPQSIPCIYAMEFDDKQKEIFYPLRISTFLKHFFLQNNNLNDELNDETDKKISLFTKQIKESEINFQKNDYNHSNSNLKNKKKNLKNENVNIDLEERRHVRTEKETIALNYLQSKLTYVNNNGSLDSIILILRSANAIDILEKIFPSLRFSGTVVIYSTIQKDIISAFYWLKSQGTLDLQIIDHFFRNYQVLQNKTHPLMQQSVSSGYVLSGMKAELLSKN